MRINADGAMDGAINRDVHVDPAYIAKTKAQFDRGRPKGASTRRLRTYLAKRKAERDAVR